MLNYTMEQKVKIISGEGSIKYIGELMKKEGKKRLY